MASRATAVARPAPRGAAPREPPRYRRDQGGRRRARGRARHADALGAPEGPPPALRPADARLRPRRLGEHGRRQAGPADRRLLAARRRRHRGLRRRRPTSRSRTSRAGPATPSRAALDAVPEDAAEIVVVYGDVPLVTGADFDAVLEARREDDAAIALASVFAADPAAARPRRARRVRDASSGSSRPRTRRPRSSRPTRRTRACTRSTRPGCAAGSPASSRRPRPASCT